MASSYRVFKPQELEIKKLTPITAKLELVSLAILASMLECNMRAEISPWLGASDASGDAGVTASSHSAITDV